MSFALLTAISAKLLTLPHCFQETKWRLATSLNIICLLLLSGFLGPSKSVTNARNREIIVSERTKRPLATNCALPREHSAIRRKDSSATTDVAVAMVRGVRRLPRKFYQFVFSRMRKNIAKSG